MPDAAYYRAWRAAHPEYRSREAARGARRRREGRRGDRSREQARRRSRAIPPLPPLHTGHPLFDAARAIVGPPRGTLVTLYDPLHDDLLSVAVLAILEGVPARPAVDAYLTAERCWGRITCPILDWHGGPE